MFDENAVDRNALTANKILNRSEDLPSGTYNGPPDTNNVAFNNAGKAYVTTTHNGNASIDLNILASILLNSGTGNTIGYWNESWDDNGSVSEETVFTGGFDMVKSDFNRGTYPNKSNQYAWFWLDIPKAQQSGNYDGNLTYGAELST